MDFEHEEQINQTLTFLLPMFAILNLREEMLSNDDYNKTNKFSIKRLKKYDDHHYFYEFDEDIFIKGINFNYSQLKYQLSFADEIISILMLQKIPLQYLMVFKKITSYSFNIIPVKLYNHLMEAYNMSNNMYENVIDINVINNQQENIVVSELQYHIQQCYGNFFSQSFRTHIDTSDFSILDLNMKDINNHETIEAFIGAGFDYKNIVKYLTTRIKNINVENVKGVLDLCSIIDNNYYNGIVDLAVTAGYYFQAVFPVLFADNDDNIIDANHFLKNDINISVNEAFKRNLSNFREVRKFIVDTKQKHSLRSQRYILSNWLLVCILLKDDIQNCIFSKETDYHHIWSYFGYILTSIDRLKRAAMGMVLYENETVKGFKCYEKVLRIINKENSLTLKQFLTLLVLAKDDYATVSDANVIHSISFGLKAFYDKFCLCNCNVWALGKQIDTSLLNSIPIVNIAPDNALLLLLKEFNYIPGDNILGLQKGPAILSLFDYPSDIKTFKDFVELYSMYADDEYCIQKNKILTKFINGSFPVQSYFDMTTTDTEELLKNIDNLTPREILSTMCIFLFQRLRNKELFIINTDTIYPREEVTKRSRNNVPIQYMIKKNSTVQNWLSVSHIHYVMNFSDAINSKTVSKELNGKIYKHLGEESRGAFILFTYISLKQNIRDYQEKHMISYEEEQFNSECHFNSDNDEDDVKIDQPLTIVHNGIVHSTEDANLNKKQFIQKFGFWVEDANHRNNFIQNTIAFLQGRKFNNSLDNANEKTNKKINKPQTTTKNTTNKQKHLQSDKKTEKKKTIQKPKVVKSCVSMEDNDKFDIVEAIARKLSGNRTRDMSRVFTQLLHNVQNDDTRDSIIRYLDDNYVKRKAKRKHSVNVQLSSDDSDSDDSDKDDSDSDESRSDDSGSEERGSDESGSDESGTDQSNNDKSNEQSNEESNESSGNNQEES